MSTMTTIQAPAEVQQFLGIFGNPGDIMEVCAIHDSESRPIQTRPHRIGDPLPWVELTALNEAGSGIFVGPAIRKSPHGTGAKGRSTDADVSHSNVLFCDWDNVGDIEAELLVICERLFELGLPLPNCFVLSGNGIHAYWRLVEPISPDKFRELQTLLARALGSDSKVTNPSRVMRLPGTRNQKAKTQEHRRLVQLRDFDPDRTADVRQFEKLNTSKQRRQNDDSGPLEVFPLHPRTIRYIKEGHTLREGERNAALFKAAADFKGTNRPHSLALRALKEPAIASGLDLSEIERTIASAYSKDRTPTAKNCFAARDDGFYICRFNPKTNRTEEDRISTFTARIVYYDQYDNGDPQLTIEFKCGNRTGQFTCAPSDLFERDWMLRLIGPEAHTELGQGNLELLRQAIFEFSKDYQRRRVFGSIGWVCVDGNWIYVHAAGASTADGLDTSVLVDVPRELQLHSLPAAQDPKASIQKTMQCLFALGPDHIVFPLLGAVFAAPVLSGLILNLIGPTGAFKTETALLFQGFWGRDFNLTNVRVTWESTPYGMLILHSRCCDAVLLIDDYVPGTGGQRQQIADRLKLNTVIGAAGNQSNRVRGTRDAQTMKQPELRGTIFMTSEHCDATASRMARTLPIPMDYGAITSEKLTAAQKSRDEGVFADGMAGLIQRLAKDLPGWREWARDSVNRERIGIQAIAHQREVTTFAKLITGIKLFLWYAREIGAVSESESVEIEARARNAITKAIQIQAASMVERQPAQEFINVLRQGLATKRMRLKSLRVKDKAIASPRLECIDNDWPGADLIGYVEFDGTQDKWRVYLLCDAARNAAAKIIEENGGSFVPKNTLSAALDKEKMLLDNSKGKNSLRRSFFGVLQYVWVLKFDALFDVAALANNQSDEPKAEY